jgi:hypothetical protein
MPGFPLFAVRHKDEIEYFQNEIELMLRTALNSIELKNEGVYVQASTLGSLEAFLQLLKTYHIPVKFSSNNSSLNFIFYSMRELILDQSIEKMLFEHQLNLKRMSSK